ncbi:DUF2247 family protein [Pectobacterium sp. CHL-2024]|uniref:DUF2247 family protein n=1 Tax=Pectobacterium sp. CHL-2024 TaxID=3377079 RepID=UPI00382AC550
MTEKLFLMANRMKLVDWGMIFLGAGGIASGKLSASEISSFACNELAKTDGVKDILLTAISEVAFCSEITDEVMDCLRFICDEENIDLKLSSRKWRCLALCLTIQELPDDCVYGLLKLNEFWRIWGEDAGTPNIIQGVANNISPTEYYTEKKYKAVIENHQKWLEKENHELLKD